MGKKVKSKSRQQARRAAKSLAALGEFETSPNESANGALVETLSNKNLPIVRWSRAGDLAQLVFGVRAVARLGGVHSYAFTLNLNPQYQQRALSDPDWLRRRIVHHVGARVPMVISLGYSRAEVLHVHGAVVVRGAVAAAPDDLQRVTAALEAAGGPWASDRGDGHQLVLKPMHDPDGWARYLNRNRLEAEPVIKRGRAWSMTNAARSEAMANYEELRQRINAATRGRKDDDMQNDNDAWQDFPPELPEEQRHALAALSAWTKSQLATGADPKVLARAYAAHAASLIVVAVGPNAAQRLLIDTARRVRDMHRGDDPTNPPQPPAIN